LPRFFRHNIMYYGGNFGHNNMTDVLV
jgi:hypothetical protein